MSSKDFLGNYLKMHVFSLKENVLRLKKHRDRKEYACGFKFLFYFLFETVHPFCSVNSWAKFGTELGGTSSRPQDQWSMNFVQVSRKMEIEISLVAG